MAIITIKESTFLRWVRLCRQYMKTFHLETEDEIFNKVLDNATCRRDILCSPADTRVKP